MRYFFILLCAVSLAQAADGTEVEQFAFVAPGDCLWQSAEFAQQWSKGLSLFHALDFSAARATFQRCARSCPADPAPLHMIALCAWAQNERPQASRRLAQALGKKNPPAASAVAMAALQVNEGDNAVAVGWLRKGLRELSVAERSYWLTRAPFNALWQNASPAWAELLDEFSVPANQAETRALARPPHREDTQPTEPAKNDSPLRLSPFDPDLSPEQQALQIQQQIDQRLISRIRPIGDDALPLDLPADSEKELQEP